MSVGMQVGIGSYSLSPEAYSSRMGPLLDRSTSPKGQFGEIDEASDKLMKMSSIHLSHEEQAAFRLDLTKNVTLIKDSLRAFSTSLCPDDLRAKISELRSKAHEFFRNTETYHHKRTLIDLQFSSAQEAVRNSGADISFTPFALGGSLPSFDDHFASMTVGPPIALQLAPSPGAPKTDYSSPFRRTIKATEKILIATQPSIRISRDALAQKAMDRLKPGLSAKPALKAPESQAKLLSFAIRKNSSQHFADRETGDNYLAAMGDVHLIRLSIDVVEKAGEITFDLLGDVPEFALIGRGVELVRKGIVNLSSKAVRGACKISGIDKVCAIAQRVDCIVREWSEKKIQQIKRNIQELSVEWEDTYGIPHENTMQFFEDLKTIGEFTVHQKMDLSPPIGVKRIDP